MVLTYCQLQNKVAFMPRKLRLEYPGAIYHVMNRGEDGAALVHEVYHTPTGGGIINELHTVMNSENLYRAWAGFPRRTHYQGWGEVPHRPVFHREGVRDD
jgi:hypothetical protein